MSSRSKKTRKVGLIGVRKDPDFNKKKIPLHLQNRRSTPVTKRVAEMRLSLRPSKRSVPQEIKIRATAVKSPLS